MMRVRAVSPCPPVLLACLLASLLLCPAVPPSTATTAAPAVGATPAGGPPLLLRNPALSAAAIAFEFAGDLWTVPREGGEARRLTSAPGRESLPAFSPDGRWLAFTGTNEGNQDLYVMPANGGAPRRLTWHPGPDLVAGWTPDGARIVFQSARESATDYVRLFTIGLDDGLPVAVDLPAAAHGSFSPDGKRLAYVPFEPWQPYWKRHRGGQTTPIWIANLADAALEKVPRENSNDTNPMWVGDRVCFLSDREGPVTLFAYDTARRAVTRLLPAANFDIKSASAGPGAIVYEKLGEIRLYDLASGADRRVPITVDSDLLETRPRWVSVGDAARAPALSPTGARAAFEARGEIFTVPAKKGDARNVSASPATAERDPVWSPDGLRLAYFSDAGGEYALHIKAQDGGGEAKVVDLGSPPSFFYQPRWSPDGKKILYHDKRLTLWYVNVDGGAPVKVDQDYAETFERSLDPAWSPDSRWIAYTKKLPSNMHAVFLYDLQSKTSFQATDGLSDARYPAFDASGKYLYFTASTDLGPASSWLDLSGVGRPVTRSVYVAVLRQDLPSPLAPESDEEKPADDGDAKAGDKADGKAGAKDGAKKGDKDAKKDGQDGGADAPRVTIDRDGLSQRILSLPLPARNYAGLAPGKEGVLFVVEAPAVPGDDDAPPLTVHRFSLEKREPEQFLQGVAAFTVAGKGEKVLYRKDGGWFIAGADSPPAAGEGGLKLDGLQLLVDPRAEWRQMFREAWRLQRDFMYDPNLHGLDLDKAIARYAPFVEGMGSRADLNYLFMDMLGELTLGHVWIGGGDTPKTGSVKNGLLGADLAIENGRYRFRRVYDGENWNPDLRAPLTQPGVNVKAGEYLLAVDGRELRPPASPYAALANTAGKQVRLRVGPTPDGKDARDVTVVPVDDESSLRHFAWVEDNRRTVDRLTDGRVAYVFLPDTGGGGYSYFNRYFFAQVGKEAVVLDERFNHGGLLADYIIDHLKRPAMSMVVTREGADQISPAGAIFGPKVMIVNELAGSGGDAMPWYFRKAGVGKLVGKKTWGGLVGIWDYPPLLDGGRVMAPRGVLYGLDGQIHVENTGVAPDVDVELDPKLWREGRDAQLEAAVRIVMDELQRNPLPKYTKPPYPNYHQGGPLGK